MLLRTKRKAGGIFSLWELRFHCNRSGGAVQGQILHLMGQDNRSVLGCLIYTFGNYNRLWLWSTERQRFETWSLSDCVFGEATSCCCCCCGCCWCGCVWATVATVAVAVPPGMKMSWEARGARRERLTCVEQSRWLEGGPNDTFI